MTTTPEQARRTAPGEPHLISLIKARIAEVWWSR
jgi:hypothetical protein